MGTSACPSSSNSLPLDHPHAYGDKISKLLRGYLTVGSSPRVWGQARVYVDINTGDGIFPTRMGTRFPATKICLVYQDHPHAYGDKSCSFAPADSVAGSSPRVWGQEVKMNKIPSRCRIIPTRMGTRFPLLRQSSL